MTEQELNEALHFVLESVPAADRADYVAALLDAIERPATAGGLEAVDRTLLGSSGGYAFHWEDVLEVGDAWDALEAIRSGFSPMETAKLVVALVKGWRRLRAVRVSLTPAQFRVLRAVKRGRGTVEAIAAYTGLSAAAVTAATTELAALRYRQDIPLLTVTAAGFATEF